MKKESSRNSHLSFFISQFSKRPLWRKVVDILLVLFALAGAAIIGAWGIYQLGLTNNRGAVDKNYRYLVSVSEMEGRDAATQEELDEYWASQLDRLADLAHNYPLNARLILNASSRSDDPMIIDRMVAALAVYTDSSELRTPNSELRTPNSELRTPNPELRTPNSELKMPSLG